MMFGIAIAGIKGYLTLGLIIAGVALAGFIVTKVYMAGVYAERIANYEASIKKLKDDLAKNEEIINEANIDAAIDEANEEKLKELVNELRNDKSCPLSKQHIDGLRRIDEGP